MAVWKKGRNFIVSFALVAFFASTTFAATYNDAISGNVSQDKIHDVKENIDLKRQNTQKKIRELKLKETREINKLYKSQGNLEVTKKELQITTQNLEDTKRKLSRLQYSLDAANAKYNKNQEAMGKRVREIYKGERLSFLNVIFMAENITVLLDKIYYQQLLAKKDADQLAELKKQVDELSEYARQIEEQKRSVLYSMARIQNKKDKMNPSIFFKKKREEMEDE